MGVLWVAAHRGPVRYAQAHGRRSTRRQEDCRCSPNEGLGNGEKSGPAHGLTAKPARASGANNGTRQWRATCKEAETRGQTTNTQRRCWHSGSVPRLCTRHTSRQEAVLLSLCLGLALARGLRLSRPLGHLTRSASASVARHFGTLSEGHPYQQDDLLIFYRLHGPEHFRPSPAARPCVA